MQPSIRKSYSIHTAKATAKKKKKKKGKRGVKKKEEEEESMQRSAMPMPMYAYAMNETNQFVIPITGSHQVISRSIDQSTNN
jgi:hypothetical protein